MLSSAYVFRVEEVFVDSQRNSSDWGGDFDVLTIFVRVDDNPTYGYTIPVASQMQTSNSVGLGGLGQTDPIEIGPDAFVTTLYLITNYAGLSIPNPISAYQNVVDTAMPYVEAVGNLFDLNIAAYQTYIDDALIALGFLYGGGGPDCHGPTFAGGFQYVGSELANLTDGWVTHRPATMVQGAINGPPITITQDGCGAPQTRINIAVERVAPVLDVLQTSPTAATVFVSTPFQALKTIEFNLETPPGRDVSWQSLGGSIVGEPAYVVPRPLGAPLPVPRDASSLHCFALGDDATSIFHKWRDVGGWHPGLDAWEQLPGQAIGGVRALNTIGGQIDLFVTGTDNNFYHAVVAGSAEHWSFEDWTVSAPGAGVIGPPFVVWTPADDFDVFGVRSPNNDVNTTNVLGTHVEAGGWIAWQSLTFSGEWVDRSQSDPSNEMNVFFRALGKASVACTADDSGRPNVIAVGRNGFVYASMSDAEPGGLGPFTGFDGAGLYGLGGDGSVTTLAAATLGPPRPAKGVEPAAGGTATWVAFVGGNHRLYASNWWSSDWYPYRESGPSYAPFVPAQYDLDGACIGRPVILPDQNAQRVYFFVLGVDEEVYWKYCEKGVGQVGTVPDWEYPGWFPSQQGWFGPVKDSTLLGGPPVHFPGVL